MKYIFALCYLLLATATAKSAFDGESPVEAINDRPLMPQKGAGVYGNAWMSLIPTPEYGNATRIINYIVVVRDSNNEIVARCYSNAKGQFQIALKPGKYSLRDVTWFKNDPSDKGAYYSDKQFGGVQSKTWNKSALKFP